MKFLTTLILAVLFALNSFASVTALSYSGTNVTTSAYTTVVSSASTSYSKVVVCDTSGKIMKLAIGAAGHEVDFVGGISACTFIPVLIQTGDRISVKAIDATATSGYLTLSLVQ